MTAKNNKEEPVHINVFAGFIIIGVGSLDNVLYQEKDYEDAIRHISGMFNRKNLDYIEEFLYYNSTVVKELKDKKPKPSLGGEQLSLF